MPGELFLLPLKPCWLASGVPKETEHSVRLYKNDTCPWCELSIISYTSSISAQSNFAVGAVVNASFGSITELTFYITALIRGHQAGNQCLQEIVKSALTGTLLGCILFVPVSPTAFISQIIDLKMENSYWASFNYPSFTLCTQYGNKWMFKSAASLVLFSGHLHDNWRIEAQRANIQHSLYRSELCIAFHLCRRQVNWTFQRQTARWMDEIISGYRNIHVLSPRFTSGQV